MESNNIGIVMPSRDLVAQPVVWNRFTPVSSCSFKEVMSETLALEMQQKEVENATAIEYVWCAFDGLLSTAAENLLCFTSISLFLYSIFLGAYSK